MIGSIGRSRNSTRWDCDATSDRVGGKTAMMRLYALMAIILSLKMFAIGVVQGLARAGAKKFANPEDAKMFGAELVPQEVPTVQRANNAWRNDLENIPIFLILALVYVIAGLSPRAFI